MNPLEYIIGAILLVMAVALVVIIMMQESRQRGLSATLSGGGDTFFGKNKGKSKQKMLVKATGLLAIVFAVLVLTLYVFQGKDLGAKDESKPASEATSQSAPSSEDTVSGADVSTGTGAASGEEESTGEELSGPEESQPKTSETGN